jgi:DNA-directed RNA polymerase subunit H (RpoH/RPB5)|tara:strand:+ start:210 stop:833 length:624 start_codon:yes stop_codon:yes gene_type:complete
MTSSESILNIYKSRNTLIEILQQREFNVDDYNEFSINEINVMFNNNQLDLLLENSNNKIFVKYYLGKSLRPNNILEIAEDLFNLEEILNKTDELLIIVKDDINDSIKNTLIQLWEQQNIFISIISLKRLQYNILNHVLVPEHIIMSNEEKNDIKSRYNIVNDSKFPQISRFDPVATVIGLRPEQLCKIIRSSKTAITSEYFRLCYNK